MKPLAELINQMWKDSLLKRLLKVKKSARHEDTKVERKTQEIKKPQSG